MKSNLNNNKGSTLPLVMIIVFVMILLSMALLDMGFIETKYAINQEQRTQSYYIARSSAHAMAAHIMNNPWDVDDLIGHTGTGEYAGGSFEVTVSKNEELNNIKVSSSSTLGSYTQSLSVTLKPIPGSGFFDNAISQNSDNELKLDALDIVGPTNTAITVKSGGEITDAQDTIKTFPNSNREYIKAKFPNPSDLTSGGILDISNNDDPETIIGDKYFDKVEVDTQGTLIFDTQGQEQRILVEKFENKGTIEITGGGIVSLFITESGEIQTPNANFSSSNLNIYVAPEKKLRMIAGSNTHAYIYAPYATIKMQAANQTFNGAIVGNIVKGQGESPMGRLNYVPFSDDIDLSNILRGYTIYVWE